VPDLIGIARLAAESPRIEAKSRVEYFDLATRSFLTRCDSPRMPFGWTINPYRGCEFGCKYCYARYAHEFMELRDPLQFERKIFAKHFDPPRFHEELTRLPIGESIALGTATDPYQPAERRYRVTRAILEVFASTAGYRLGITTKSDLVTRDLDLLREISRRHYLSIHVTITTTDRDLARLLEPLAPRPDLRLSAVRKLTAAGLRASVFCAPIMPLINDTDPSLDALAKSAKRAGSCGFAGSVLFLKPCAREVFLPFLAEHFPLLVRRYRERFERAAYLRGDYPETVYERVRRVRQRYGLETRELPPEPELWPQERQLALFDSLS
jgi:DNA repair photolyase